MIAADARPPGRRIHGRGSIFRIASILILVSLGSGILACCGPSQSFSPDGDLWERMTAISAAFRRKACSAAWTHEFVTDHAMLNRMSLEERERDCGLVELQAIPSTPAVWARVYLIGDPTDREHPPTKHRVILTSCLGTSIITSDSFFMNLFACLHEAGREPTRDDLFSICKLYIQLFGGNSPLSAIPEILFSPVDIPSDPDSPIEEECRKQIMPPIMEHRRVPGWKDPEDMEFKFSCEITTWDPSFGTVTRWSFKMNCFPYKVGRSDVKVNRREIASDVGIYMGPK